ncbi:MAG: hypothetical protein JKY65_08735 [Planctomycetes bacterium]|nr:hypothetical protein [Planctomycetota bacterium]
MNGTAKAILGCLATLLLLGGVVTYLENRLPSETRAIVERDSDLAKKDLASLKALQNKIRSELKKNGDLLGETAKSEHWEDLVQLALEDLVTVEKRIKDEVAPLVAKNSRDDEARIHEILDELVKKREEATKSVSHLAARVKELADILPRAAKTYEELGKRLGADKATNARLSTAISDLAKKTPEIEPILAREQWREHLTKCGAALAAVAAKHKDLGAKAREKSLKAAKEVIKTSNLLGAERSRAMAKSRQVGQQFEALKTFIRKRSTYGPQVERDLKALKSFGFAAVAASAEESATRYAFNATEIKRRTVAFAQVESGAQRAGERALLELKNPLGEIDPARVVRSVDLVHKRRAKGRSIIAAFKKQITDLDRSYEKVLVDMEIKEGYEVSFHQEFLTVTAIRGQPGAKTKRTWTKVNAAEYKRLEKGLGTAVAQKPYGYFTDQTERAHPAPAGMSYVGNTAYGSWENDKWVFNDHSQTKVLVGTAWGTHYPGYSRSDYRSYHRRGPIWWGRDRWGHNRYGSGGSLTLLIYSRSRYVRHGGYVRTRYMTSGRRYRGTRYARRGSTTVFVGGSRGRGSRGSRRSSYGK